MFLEAGEVLLLIVRAALLPHSPDDALPFEGQLTDSLVMVHRLAELLVGGGRPGREFDRGVGKFMPALAQEFGTAPAHMHPALVFAAPFGYRRHAGIATEGHRFLKTMAIGAQGGQQARSQNGSGAR